MPYSLTDEQGELIHKITRCLACAGDLTELLGTMTQAESDLIHRIMDATQPHGPLAWDDPRFTEEDRNLMVICVEEEIRDCTKDLAFEQLAGEDLVDLIAYADPDPDGTAQTIEHLGNPEETYVNGEFLRGLPDDGDDYPNRLDYAKRMGLINDDETELTPLGREYVEKFH